MDDAPDQPDQPEEHHHHDFVEEEREHRLGKLKALADRGIAPYPPRFDRDHWIEEIREKYPSLEPGADTGDEVSVAGRIMLLRRQGKLVFADLHDQTGTIQLFVSQKDVGDERFEDIAEWDRGDWVGAKGTVIATKRGELSVRVTQEQLLSKSLRALPDKHKGLTDVDTRLRQRYLDLIVNPETRRVFDIRHKAIASVRKTLHDRGFVEVETPVLDNKAGGAEARPFITHHNALDIDMYLRIALELYLKRCVVGGFERVFEMGRVFRNEGLDTRHNPEFTMLEAYQALADYHDMMDLVEAIVVNASRDSLDSTVITLGDHDVDLAKPWKRITMADLIEEVNPGVKMHPSMPVEEARAIAERLHIPDIESWWGSGRLMSEVYDETCESTLIEPTFVYDYPREVSPLARTHRADPTMTERFECVVAGRELANAYSELNDPLDQKTRFEAEARAKELGDEEAGSVDLDYIRALEYGLPPTGGLGIGIDRMVMLLTGAPAIRDVLLFPTMRPEGGMGERASHRGLSSESVPSADELAEEAQEAPAPEPAKVQADDPADRRPVNLLPDHAAARLLAWLTALAGLLYLLPELPVLHGRLGVVQDYFADESIRVIGHVVSVVTGFVLILVAIELGRRKRLAWQAAVFIFALGVITHLFKGPHPIVVLFSMAMVVALVWYRDAFPGRSDPASLLGLVRFVPLYFGAVLVFGISTMLLEQEHIDQTLTVGGMLQTTFAGLIGLDGPYTYTGIFFPDFFPAALLGLGIAGLVIAFAIAFRVVVERAGASEGDRDRARALVRKYGSDTLAPFALRTDKSYFFSSDGRAMIAYTYVSGYALVAADPIGDRGSLERVLDEFLAYCRTRAWHVAFLAVREDDMAVYNAHGFRGVYLGDEAIIRCDTFTLDGSALKQVRSAVNKVGKAHHFRLMRESDASPALVRSLNAIRERWRGKAPERGFTMELGQDVQGENPDFLLAVAMDADDHPVAFLRLVPCYGPDPGYSLDLMQREPDSVNGVTEYLIANAALALGERGFKRLSMNFAAWGRLFDASASLTPPQRVLRKVAEVLNPFFQIESLRDFNEKFAPEWLPRSIVIEDPAAMPKVGILYASVEGFLNVPVVGRYLVPQVRSEQGAG
jgi:lysyl-tRNA synthetase, class II